ncbi:MAG: sterol desaturase family protein [Rhodothermales bacterium]|nr:sterol desaturase family protein [Rhodothermales bacterium]MBO6779267.1 sterol desaturase family protein [Rhodothermales bacterium]
METYATALLVAIPLFSGLIVVEALYGARRGVQTLNSMDTISSLSSGVTNVVKDSLGVVLVILSYPFVLGSMALFELEAVWWVYLIGFVALDFAGYWSHRLNHSVNFFWNNHVIHHSSEEFNLACALRQSISNLLGYYAIFLIPAALLGVPAQVINVLAPIHLFLQFWYHTRHVPKLGWLEYVIITPSQHRVHHAINPEYLDKNLGQIFPWWDRMFGTFQEELDDVPPVYGITRPAATWNPIRINFQHIWLLSKDAWRTESWRDKARIWFMPTGWRPPDVEARFPIHKIEDPYNFQKYAVPAGPALLRWSWFQFLSTIALLMLLLWNFGALETGDLFVYGGFVFLGIFGFTSMMDGLAWAPWLESARGLLGLGFLLWSGSWFGIGGPVTALGVAAYFVITVIGSPLISKST